MPDIDAINHAPLNEKQSLALFWIGNGWPVPKLRFMMARKRDYDWLVGEEKITSQVRSLLKRRLIRVRQASTTSLPTIEIIPENVDTYTRCMERRAKNKEIIKRNDKLVAEQIARLP